MFIIWLLLGFRIDSPIDFLTLSTLFWNSQFRSFLYRRKDICTVFLFLKNCWNEYVVEGSSSWKVVRLIRDVVCSSSSKKFTLLDVIKIHRKIQRIYKIGRNKYALDGHIWRIILNRMKLYFKSNRSKEFKNRSSLTLK